MKSSSSSFVYFGILCSVNTRERSHKITRLLTAFYLTSLVNSSLTSRERQEIDFANCPTCSKRVMGVPAVVLKRCISRTNQMRTMGTTSSRSEANLSSYIRNAHCTEIFRSTFYKASRAVITITPGDLDDIIVSEKVRPSLLLGCFEALGTGLGTVARFAPSQLTGALTKMVDDAASQQFNDSIREISALGPDLNDDVKETIKYHRDLTPNTPLDINPTSASPAFNETGFILATGLSNVLNLSRKL